MIGHSPIIKKSEECVESVKNITVFYAVSMKTSEICLRMLYDRSVNKIL